MDKPSDTDTSTQRQILKAAMEVIARKKVSGTRMRHVAQVAGVSQGTLHYHFPSKTGLLLAVLDSIQELFDNQRLDGLNSDQLKASQKVWLFLLQQRNTLKSQPQIEEVFLDFWGHGMIDAETRKKIQAMYTNWRHDMERVMASGLENGEFEATYVHLMPFLLVSLLEGGALQSLIDPHSFDLGEYFTVAYLLVMRLLKSDIHDLPIYDLPSVPERAREPYPTDISDVQWAQVAPLLGAPRPGGRPRATQLREVVDALAYLWRSGCPWRLLPHDFPRWQTVHAYASQWRRDGTLERIQSILGVHPAHAQLDLAPAED